MKDNIGDIAAYYNQDPQREHQRLEVNQLEFDLTLRKLIQYLPPKGHLLEVGAATGRYTLPLAERGYTITAIDLSPSQSQFNRSRLQQAGVAGKVRFLVGDNRQLGLPKKAIFDGALVMGPLYHLVEQDDRRKAISSVFTRLRQGGMIISTFISRLGILGDLMKNIPYWIELQAEVDSLLMNGRDTCRASEGFRGYFSRVDEIKPLHESAGFTTTALVGVEPAISADDESYNRLEGSQRKLWLDLLERICEEPSILGASRHLLYIGRKP